MSSLSSQRNSLFRSPVLFRQRGLRRAALAAGVLAALGLAPVARAAPSGPAPSAGGGVKLSASAKLDPKIAVFVAAPPSLRGPTSLRALTPDTIPVTIELDAAPTAEDFDRLEAAGASVQRDRYGRALASGHIVAAEVPSDRLGGLDGLTGIKKVRLDAPILSSPRPTEDTPDDTAQLVGARDTWGTRDADGVPLTGAGITICDVDAGIDPFHPQMFRADGGYFDWIDQDGDGVFTLGVDAIDLGNGPVTVRSINGVVSTYYDETPLFGTDDPTYDPDYDFLYADDNDNSERDYGPAAGFTEQTPTYGERLLVIDDVNGNRKLDVGEKLVALGTSKIKAFKLDTKTYTRGTDLIKAPWRDSMAHGVGATGVLAGGIPGLTHLVGMAPDADIVMATDSQGGRDFQMTQFCISEDARVVLHEYAPWQGYHLDGSSPTEGLIDSSSAQGVVHVNPAGNLSTSQKLYKRDLPAGSTTPITIDVPDLGETYFGTSILWRDTSKNLTFTLVGPDGTTKTVDTSTTGSQVPWGDQGLQFYSFREDSDRGTARVDFYIAQPQFTKAVPPGTWTLTVTDPSPPEGETFTLFAYTQDEVSGWGKGINFPEFSSEDHLIGYPGTADHGMPISAFTANDWGIGSPGTPGARAYYSGRGYRIDGEKIMWIGGPDNPITSAKFTDRPLSYQIYGGTSGASPHVAGSAALIVQHDPSLKGDDVKNAIKAGAVTDEFTGAVPNDDFGWGKLNVYRAIYGHDAPGGSAPTITADELTMAVGSGQASYTASDADEAESGLKVEADLDYDGTYDTDVSGGVLPVSFDTVGEHFVKLRVTDSTGKTGTTLLDVHVEDNHELDGSGSTTGGGKASGGGCSVSSDDASGDSEKPLGTLAIGLALAAVSRRRRR